MCTLLRLEGDVKVHGIWLPDPRVVQRSQDSVWHLTSPVYEVIQQLVVQ